MDSLELLNVLDVIKNEEVYTKRLEQLKAVQKKLDESQYIVATVEKANDIMEKAIKDREKTLKLIEKLEEDIKKSKVAAEADYKERDDLLTKKSKNIENREAEARRFTAIAKEQITENEKRTKELLEWEKSLFVIEKNAKEIEQLYTSKFKRIESIIKE